MTTTITLISLLLLILVNVAEGSVTSRASIGSYQEVQRVHVSSTNHSMEYDELVDLYAMSEDMEMVQLDLDRPAKRNIWRKRLLNLFAPKKQQSQSQSQVLQNELMDDGHEAIFQTMALVDLISFD